MEILKPTFTCVRIPLSFHYTIKHPPSVSKGQSERARKELSVREASLFLMMVNKSILSAQMICSNMAQIPLPVVSCPLSIIYCSCLFVRGCVRLFTHLSCSALQRRLHFSTLMLTCANICTTLWYRDTETNMWACRMSSLPRLEQAAVHFLPHLYDKVPCLHVCILFDIVCIFCIVFCIFVTSNSNLF